ncbi:MAG: GNAT family N-acetyltransferase [Cyclobacteriaceae bacterium]
MTSKFTFRQLSQEDLPQMYRTFIDAFSKYKVKMDMTKEAFKERMEGKVNISYRHSIGAFHGEKLIGFIFNSLNTFEGQKSAYNGGTGVLYDYWGYGLTKRMYDHVVPILTEAGVQRCVLEVITTNTPAIKAYEKSGFTKTKNFKCFKLNNELPLRESHKGLVIKKATPKSLSSYQKLATANPSMLDSFGHLILNIRNETCFEARLDNGIVGYIIYQVQKGRISQICVKEGYRRQGIGNALMRRALNAGENKNLTVLNVEESEAEIIQFLKSNGFVNELDQFEMVMDLGVSRKA